MDLTPLLNVIASSNGIQGALNVLFIVVIYKLFGKLEDARREQRDDAKAAQDDYRKLAEVTTVMRPLIQDLSDKLAHANRGRG